MWYEFIVNKGVLPDLAVRFIVRLLLKRYSKKFQSMNATRIKEIQNIFLADANREDIALATKEANQQHYEIDTIFYQNILGQSLKYSGSQWSKESIGLDEADKFTLNLYTKRLGIEESQNILELGSGWGSLSLHMAEQYPNANITTITNSLSQKEYIEKRRTEFQLGNLNVVHADINTYEPTTGFDRIISIEMFEHLRNPQRLMRKIEQWLNPNGYLFIQVFSHRCYPQFFDNTKSSWMARNFFTAGMMPYDGFYEQIAGSLQLSNKWTISGLNYHLSLESWLKNLKALKKNSKAGHMAFKLPEKHFDNKYCLFLILCSELFRWNNGEDWYVLHYLFHKSAKANS